MKKCPLFTLSFQLLFLSLASSLSAQVKAVVDYKEILKPGETSVWSPLFQATWDKLNKQIGGELIKVAPANRVMTGLDKFAWKESEVMPQGAYACYAGPANEGFLAQARAKLKKQFGDEVKIGRVPASEDGVVAYGALVRNLEFKKPLLKAKNKVLQFKDNAGNTSLVEFFGSAKSYSDNYRNSISVNRYQYKGKEFMLSFTTKHPGEKVVIYRPLKPTTFQTAITSVKLGMKNPLKGEYGSILDPKLHKKDTLKIPYIDLESKADFLSQLGGLRYYSGKDQPWRIVAAKQFTKFELHEKGAKVRVVTEAGAEPFGPAPIEKITPRKFICDRPFFVFLWKDNAKLPYFATWIDSPDSLKKTSK